MQEGLKGFVLVNERYHVGKTLNAKEFNRIMREAAFIHGMSFLPMGFWCAVDGHSVNSLMELLGIIEEKFDVWPVEYHQLLEELRVFVLLALLEKDRGAFELAIEKHKSDMALSLQVHHCIEKWPQLRKHGDDHHLLVRLQAVLLNAYIVASGEINNFENAVIFRDIIEWQPDLFSRQVKDAVDNKLIELM